jgi:CRISPR-associated protein Csb3
VSFRIDANVTNPAQFFGCCGLFELVSRLDADAMAQFDRDSFVVSGGVELSALLDRLTAAGLEQIDPSDSTASPIRIPPPFGLRLDWWKDDASGGRDLKVWAGSMQSVRIAQAMLAALRDPALHTPALFDVGQIVYDPAEPTKKVEPFYFDARRASNAHSLDIGFSPNDLDLTTTAFPATEVLCLIGLQRFRPSETGESRVFEYCTWSDPLPAPIAAMVVAGAVSMRGTRRYRFENWFRSGQRKHKAFRAAVPVAEGK